MIQQAIRAKQNRIYET